ncbi:hypothetical protein BU24DRAFT_429415 [Aaosphaeria arxii CBS 175.79]|uniref:ADP-ribosylation n=1 Tax=Aaosphaeria arxii CBS 175.79 TaxID=1450172 RepID=A0A6A5X5X8_9PLEO|nr:uncharacterized protein BU24DRAFT_429415 [Aaosphaeria arxii CBS 175.79]KAF2008405.1 hypothetical protein BU24DRAFT_429415 [Aaosphaeria arxii CBS 175.79]
MKHSTALIYLCASLGMVHGAVVPYSEGSVDPLDFEQEASALAVRDEKDGKWPMWDAKRKGKQTKRDGGEMKNHEINKEDYNKLKGKHPEGHRLNPKIAKYNCKGDGVTSVCEADCIGILCFNVPWKIRWVGDGPDSRDQSGALKGFLKGTMENQLRHGFFVTDQVKAKLGDSLEETCHASSDQGGKSEVMMLVKGDDNKQHGTQAIQAAMKKGKVDKGDWVIRLFEQLEANQAPTCDALMDVWEKKSTWLQAYNKACTGAIWDDPLHPINNAYMPINEADRVKAVKGKGKEQEIKFYYHRMGPLDEWVEHGWRVDSEHGRDENPHPEIVYQQGEHKIYVIGEGNDEPPTSKPKTDEKK